MASWIIGMVTIGSVMTVVLKLLPENSVKKAAYMAFGIIFLMVTVAPVGKLFSSGFKSKNIIGLFDDEILSVKENNDVSCIEDVVNTYCQSLENAVETALYEEMGYKCEAEIDVCGDINSDSFGKVISVSCNIFFVEKPETEKDDGIITNIPLVKDIVITLDGKNDKYDSGSIDVSSAVVYIAEMLGVSEEICTVNA